VNSLADKSAQIADNQVSIMVLAVHAMLAIALIMVGCQQKRWN
jgi:predicted transporter